MSALAHFFGATFRRDLRRPTGGLTNVRTLRGRVTADYIAKLANGGLYDNATFYRSDFVIQCGTHGLGRPNPLGDLPVNETFQHARVSNTRGTAAIAHFDVPDNGNSEFFINLQTNAHLDEVYGGYCVFASIAEGDAASFATVDKIAAAVKTAGKVMITSMRAA